MLQQLLPVLATAALDQAALGRREELLWALAPAIIITALLALSLVYFALIVRPRMTDADRRHHKQAAAIPPLLVELFYWWPSGLIRLLIRLRVTPNMVTSAALLLSCASGVALALGHFTIGTALLLPAGTLDAVDGVLARETNQSRASGAFLDSYLDRYAEGVVFIGLALYGAGGPLTIAACVAMLISFGISYAAARGESLGVRVGDVGRMRRGERVFILLWGIFLSPVVAVFVEPGVARPVYHLSVIACALIATFGSVTALKRAQHIMRALDAEEQASNVS